ncbi:hypothetical protein ACHQM5_009813 [Ranunculus cassubicifolius]
MSIDVRTVRKMSKEINIHLPKEQNILSPEEFLFVVDENLEKIMEETCTMMKKYKLPPEQNKKEMAAASVVKAQV